MKTNFNNPEKLVLLDEWQQIMAIISVEPGEQNISDKVALAIKEDMGAENVIIEKSISVHFSKNGVYNFDAEVIENNDNNVYNFELIPVTEY